MTLCDDGDSMSDKFELANGFDPFDGTDCPSWFCTQLPMSVIRIAHKNSNDYDLGGDGLTNGREDGLGTSRTNADSDGDGLSDGREVKELGTNPLLSDSDADGLSDQYELETSGTNPVVADTDSDGLSDGAELSLHNSNPLNTDSDGDSMPDGEEVAAGFSPTDESDCPRWYCGGLSPAVIEAAIP